MKGKRGSRILALCLALLLLACAVAGPALAEGETGAAPALTEEERAFAASLGTLKVGFVQDRPPVSFADENGELRGISRLIFDRLAELTGLTFEYVPLPLESVTYDYLLSQGFDLVTSVEYNPENMNARGILMSKPYFSARKVVVAPQDLDFDPTAPLTVAVSSGSQTIKKVLARVYPSFTVTDYPDLTSCFDAVSEGEADLTILNQYVVEYWYAKPAYEDLKVIPVQGMDESLCFSAVVPIEGDEALNARGKAIIDLLDRGIAAISEDELGSYTVQAVMDYQYEPTFSDFLYRYRHAAAILAVAAVVILAMASLLLWAHVRSLEARADARAKSQFLSTMSHEIRTPLNGLMGLNYLMAQKLDDPQRLTEYLSQSTATAGYLLTLVDDILDMSSLRDRSLELKPEPLDLELLTESCALSTRRAMEDKEIDFQVRFALPDPYVLGDGVRLRQILLNLLDNAQKFTPAGGRVTLDASQRREGSRVVTVFTVSDTGRGMSEEFQKALFTPFSRELDTVSKGNQGTGLGLAISQGLAQAMGGSLTVKSAVGEGSAFTFTFPSEVAETAPADQQPTGSGQSGKARTRVLVAEDNELNGEIMLELLAGEGFDADLAHDGKEALELFAASDTGAYGLILMDLLMPRMDGCQASKAIRELDRPDAKTVRIVACTANDFQEDRARAHAAGMDDFIPKPVDVPTLLTILDSLP